MPVVDNEPSDDELYQQAIDYLKLIKRLRFELVARYAFVEFALNTLISRKKYGDDDIRYALHQAFANFHVATVHDSRFDQVLSLVSVIERADNASRRK